MQRFTTSRWLWLRTWNIYKTSETIYRETKKKSCQIMWRLNTSTYFRNILLVCNIVFPMSNFTAIVTLQVLVNIECDEVWHWMQGCQLPKGIVKCMFIFMYDILRCFKIQIHCDISYTFRGCLRRIRCCFFDTSS